MTNGAQQGPLYTQPLPESKVAVIKSILKTAGAILLIIQFAFFHPFLAILSMVVYYFSLPGRYRTDQVAQCIEAFIRPGIGALLAGYVGWVLSRSVGFNLSGLLFFIGAISITAGFTCVLIYGLKNQGTWLQVIVTIILGVVISGVFGAAGAYSGGPYYSILSISSLIFAFYCVLPIRVPAMVGNTTVVVPILLSKGNTKIDDLKAKFGDALSGPERSLIGNAIFATLMALSLGNLIEMSGFGPTGAFEIPLITVILVTVWFLALVTGLFTTPEARPYVGSLVLIMAIFVFSFQYTGVVGTALFGNWWPTIEHGISIIAQPLGDAYSTVQNQMRCLQILMTNPALYSTTPGCGAPMPQTEAVGSVSAVQIEDLDAINGVTGENNIYADAPLIGTFTIRNAGDFVASNMWVKNETIQLKDPTKVSAAHPEQGYTPINDPNEGWGNNICKFESCTGTNPDVDGTCSWPPAGEEGGIYKDYKSLVTFKCGSPGTDGDIGKWEYKYTCVDEKGNTLKECVDNCDSGTKLYCHAGWFVSIPFKYGFTYSVNASAPVVVMNASVFQKKLLAKEISLEEKETKYTGGPVEIAIWTQKQPLRSGETSYGRLMIINRGDGKVKNLQGTIKFVNPNIKIRELKPISTYGGQITCASIETKSESPTFPIVKEETSFSFKADELEKDKINYCTFQFILDIEDTAIDSATGLFTTNITYSFEGEKRMEIQIGNAPIQ